MAAWRERAACRGMPTGLFYPPPGVPGGVALAVCARCPVRAECDDEAVESGEEFGIWGGRTEEERAQLTHCRRAGRRHPGPIHLMVTDVLLTGPMNGVELADQLSYERPEMKVLFATGYPAGLADRPSLLRREELLLKKPFSGRALAERVRDVLASSE